MPPYLEVGLMRFLDGEYHRQWELHYKSAPRNGDLPVGGGDWMDTFFRLEAIRGCLNALRIKKPIEEAIEDGKAVSEIAVQIWNGKREWQVHRWEKTAHAYLEGLIRRFNNLERERIANAVSNKRRGTNHNGAS